MTKPPQPVFLERRTYRRRRLRDAARLLPVLGILFLLVPLLWSSGDEAPTSTASGFIYVFAVWLGLILVAGLLSRRLAEPERPGQEPPA